MIYKLLVCLLQLYGLSSYAVDVPVGRCPYIHLCSCVDGNVKIVQCRGISPPTINSLSVHYPYIEELDVKEWDDGGKEVDLAIFSNLTFLRVLKLTDGRLYNVIASTSLPHLEVLDLSRNNIASLSLFCNISLQIATMKSLNLSKNGISELPPCLTNMPLKELDLSRNKLTDSNVSFPLKLEVLNLSDNSLTNMRTLNANLVNLNLSGNPLSEIKFPVLPKLMVLDISNTKLFMGPSLVATRLSEFIMDGTTTTYLDLDQIASSKLEKISLHNSFNLAFVYGTLAKTLKKFSLTNSKITAFPQEMFMSTNLTHVDVSGNRFDCDKCSIGWAIPIKDFVAKKIQCSVPSVKPPTCGIGISSTQPSIFFEKHGKNAIVSCNAYGHDSPKLQWWLYRPATYLGTFDPLKGVNVSNVEVNTMSRYSVLRGGALLMQNVNRSFVERYVCVAKNNIGNATQIIKFRLDYRDWYSLSLFDSVFWGALAFCIVVCAFSFILNITWILTRKSILWWIQRAERLSRVRKMVEAMEKYRVRQLESLQDKYTRRIQHVRDNYHAQVEQLRVSYSSQAERFRDYRAAQMESVTSHIENIRDNYQLQLNRMREYGSRRAEQLWESYERQVNRMKTFSLQNRLKLMRQYKIKQRHLNKLLESFTDHFSAEDMKKHEEEVRAALELPEAVPDPLSRSDSFYSLPEYILDEEGVLRPSPLVPSVRFTRAPEFRFSKDRTCSQSETGDTDNKKSDSD